MRAAVWGGILCLTLSLFAQTDVGNFRVPSVSKEGVLESVLTGEKARMYPDKPMWIEGLVIRFYEPDGETVRIRLSSPGCHYDAQNNFAESDKSVKIEGNDFTIDGVGYKFDSNTSRMEILTETRVVFRNVDFTPPRASTEPSAFSPESIESPASP